MRRILAALYWARIRLSTARDRLRLRLNGSDHVAESASVVIANLERARKRGRA